MQRDLAHALERGVGSVQHGLAGHGRAGQGHEGATVHRAHAVKLLAEGRLLGAGAEAVALGKAGVADDAALDHTLVVNTQGHRHVAAVALGAGGHAVADHIAALILGRIQAAGRVALGDGDRLIGSGRHHLAVGRVQRVHAVLLDGTLRDGIGHTQHQRCHHRDDGQHQKRRELLLGSVFFHGYRPP